MDDKKITLYLALLCIFLMIWGSVLDGKRMRLKEVLEAENADLMVLVDEASAKFEEATSRQNVLSRKLDRMQRQVKKLKARNSKLQKVNDQLRAEMEELRRLRLEAEQKSQEAAMAAEKAMAAGKASQPTSVSLSPGDSLRIQELEKKVDQLMHDQNNLRSGLHKKQKTAFGSSIAVSDIESQLRFCREEVRECQADSGETGYLKKRVERLEKELDFRTRELWETRLSMSSDLDACTMKLMEVSRKSFERAQRHAIPKPPCMQEIKSEGEPAAAGKGKCGKCGKCKKCSKCEKCPKCKEMQARLQTYISRVNALQDELYRANHRSIAEIEQLKRALREKNLECHDSMGSAEHLKAQIADKDIEIKKLQEEIRGREMELDVARSELEQYRKNTEALLEQIRQQRATIKKLKTG